MSPLMWRVAVGLCVLGLCVTPASVQEVHGKWTKWSNLTTPCSETCGGGTLERTRYCTNPQPQNGGRICLTEQHLEATKEIKTFSCNDESCWSFDEQWHPWTNCTVECGIGTRNRSANCTGPAGCGPVIPDDQLEACNTWNRTVCPDPCDDYQCIKFAGCKDISNDTHPLVKCSCVMDYKMINGSCQRPPPTTPTPRPIPTLDPEVKTVATVISKTASSVLIFFVSCSLILFLVLRIFTTDRVIQMNMEISLLCGHLFLMFPPSIVENVFMCKLISIMLHYMFLACFTFMMLEAVHMYCLVASVVKKDGYFNKLQNIIIGWLVPAAFVGVGVALDYVDYGGEYHCWLQLNKKVMPIQQLPILGMMIMTFTLIEAAGNAEYKPLKGVNKPQLMSAKISQRTNLAIVPLVYAHWVLGTLAEYEQNMYLYSIFSIVNGWLGFFVFFFHCSNNQQVRDKLEAIFKKAKGGGSV